MKYRYTEEEESAQYRVVAGYYAQLFDIYDAGLCEKEIDLDHMLANRRWEVEAYAHERGWTLDRDFTYPEQSKANRFNLVSGLKSAYSWDEWRTSQK